jgi:hypothetical protein
MEAAVSEIMGTGGMINNIVEIKVYYFLLLLLFQWM